MLTCVDVQPLLGEAVAAAAGQSVPSPINVATGGNGVTKSEDELLRKKQARISTALLTHACACLVPFIDPFVWVCAAPVRVIMGALDVPQRTVWQELSQGSSSTSIHQLGAGAWCDGSPSSHVCLTR